PVNCFGIFILISRIFSTSLSMMFPFLSGFCGSPSAISMMVQWFVRWFRGSLVQVTLKQSSALFELVVVYSFVMTSNNQAWLSTVKFKERRFFTSVQQLATIWDESRVFEDVKS